MVETASYEELGQIDGVEIRRYSKLILASVPRDVDGDPFRTLFRYISGDNSGKSEISMTTPVITPERIEMTAPVMSEEDSMSFVMPSKYTLEKVPEPNDVNIRIHEVPERKIAAVRFRGNANEKQVEEQKVKLLDTLEKNGIEIIGKPFLMRYNAPWTPGFMRRNEIGIEIR